MTHFSLNLIALIFLLLPRVLYAEEMIVTKSGTTLIGEVAFDGDAVIVKIAKGELRIPMVEISAIATIAVADGGDSVQPSQAQLLLMKALEARLFDSGGEEAAGILAEAARLAPDDARIAFWYASSLVDAGQGKAASEVFQQRRAAISAAYPGMVNALAARIERRLKLESLPHELVSRIDRLNLVAKAQPIARDQRLLFATFRLTDQHQAPVPKDVFRTEVSGQDDKLEAFDDGYFLLSFTQNRHTEGESCRLMITEPGYEIRTFEFSASSNEVKNAGVFVVEKFDKSGRKPVRVRVVGENKEPIAGAEVRLRARSSRNPSSDDSLKANTDADGDAEILAYPAGYSYTVTANGMNSAQGGVDVNPMGKVPEMQVTLYPSLRGSIRVMWLRITEDGGMEASSGETTITVPAQNRGYHPMEMSAHTWLRPVQVKDQLVLSLLTGMFGYAHPGAGRTSTWVSSVKVDASPDDPDRWQIAEQQFNGLDLNRIDELKSRHPRVKRSDLVPVQPPGSVSFVAERGNIFIGKFEIRDPRTNRPVEIAFKILVESLSDSSDHAAAL